MLKNKLPPPLLHDSRKNRNALTRKRALRCSTKRLCKFRPVGAREHHPRCHIHSIFFASRIQDFNSIQKTHFKREASHETQNETIERGNSPCMLSANNLAKKIRKSFGGPIDCPRLQNFPLTLRQTSEKIFTLLCRTIFRLRSLPQPLEKRRVNLLRRRTRKCERHNPLGIHAIKKHEPDKSCGKRKRLARAGRSPNQDIAFNHLANIAHFSSSSFAS